MAVRDHYKDDVIEVVGKAYSHMKEQRDVLIRRIEDLEREVRAQRAELAQKEETIDALKAELSKLRPKPRTITYPDQNGA